MSTQEIPHYELGRFFDEYSQLHRGWLITVEIMSPGIGAQVQVRDLPLEGITVESNEVGEDQIVILAGDSPDARISHTIDSPNRIWLKQSDQGADEALEIESADGVVLIRFRSSALPEMIDGVLSKSAEAGKRNSQ
jgi:hypothetical protein